MEAWSTSSAEARSKPSLGVSRLVFEWRDPSKIPVFFPNPGLLAKLKHSRSPRLSALSYVATRNLDRIELPLGNGSENRSSSREGQSDLYASDKKAEKRSDQFNEAKFLFHERSKQFLEFFG